MKRTTSRFIIVILVTALGIAACARDRAPVEPSGSPGQAPPVQGPAVLGDAGVEIVDWEYLGPDLNQTRPPIPPEARRVANNVHEVWLVETEEGFELIWSEFMCSTQPVLVVHADASMEFWPGEIVGQDCEAMAVPHQLNVSLQSNVPVEAWEFTLHPPPTPEA